MCALLYFLGGWGGRCEEARSDDKEEAATPRPKRKPWRQHVQGPCEKNELASLRRRTEASAAQGRGPCEIRDDWGEEGQRVGGWGREGAAHSQPDEKPLADLSRGVTHLDFRGAF